MLEHLFFGDGIPRGAKKLLAGGETATARVVGLKITERSDDADRWHLALEVGAGPGGTFRAGVRQRLAPQEERAHLGAELVVRHDGERAVIDWPASLAGWGQHEEAASASGWKAVDPPADGVEDRREAFRRPKGDPVSAELVAARRSGGVGSFGRWDVELIADGQSASERRVPVPAYAVHLLVPGTVLHAARKGDRLRVDWPASAADPRPGGSFDFSAVYGE